MSGNDFEFKPFWKKVQDKNQTYVRLVIWIISSLRDCWYQSYFMLAKGHPGGFTHILQCSLSGTPVWFGKACVRVHLHDHFSPYRQTFLFSWTSGLWYISGQARLASPDHSATWTHIRYELTQPNQVTRSPVELFFAVSAATDDTFNSPTDRGGNYRNHSLHVFTR